VSAGPWIIELPGQEGNRYSCFARCTKTAQRWARQMRAPVQIRYQGPRDRPQTAQIAEVDFLVHANGSREVNDPRYHP